MKWILVLCSIFLLAGCQRVNDSGTASAAQPENAGNRRSLVCTSDSDMYMFEATGDQIDGSTWTYAMSVDALGLEDGSDVKKVVEKVNESLQDQYGSLAGVTAAGEVEDDAIRVTIRIDYSEADTDALVDAGLLESGDIQTQYVSLDKTQKEMNANGYACKVS
jgi:uncharacterized lipoprotein YehR (DUF1307 family)